MHLGTGIMTEQTRATRRTRHLACALAAATFTASFAAGAAPPDAGSGGFPNGRALAVSVDPSDSRRVLAATTDQLYETSDGGQTWTARYRVSGDAQITSVAVDPHDPTRPFSGTPHT